jgi:hypothetical protein
VKTVGIMSMQRIHNYGSTLQAYSLRRLIEEAFESVDVSFVDYRPGPILIHDSAAPTSRLSRVVTKVREYNDVKAPLRDRLRFFDHKRAYGDRYFASAGITKKPNYNLDLDCQVIGSDEVFNCVQSNSKVGYSPDLFGRGTPARHLISYAASFGNTTLDKLRAAGIADVVALDLQRFDALSVRDRNSRDIVHKLTGSEPVVHVDPALSYDLMRDPRVPTGRLHADPYIIVYGYSGRLTPQENAALRVHAKSIGARILTFGGVQECGDAFIECTPFELLAYFRDAAGIVTDTFHGTIFSLINNRPFATIVRASGKLGYGNEEKLGYLLELFEVSSRRLAGADQIEDVLATPPDCGATEALLTRERARTREYLETNVGIALKQDMR